MTQYLLRRTTILVVSLLVAMVVIFLLLRALPGDPANALLSGQRDARADRRSPGPGRGGPARSSSSS